MLLARHLACERGGRALFRGLALDVRAGSLVEIRGANGCGKSRLLRILAGITNDWSGQLDRQVEALYIGHENGLQPKLTVLENLRWIASLHGARENAIRQGLEAFAVTGLIHRPCETLSVGQQRRVALARLKMRAAMLWLLDEPTNSLDAASERRFLALLARHIEAGGAAVVATHGTDGSVSDFPVAATRVIEL